MHNEKIYLERIKRFLTRIKDSVYGSRISIPVRYIYSDDPIPIPDINAAPFRNINKGDVWGKAWGSAWFHIKGIVPEELDGKQIGLWFDSDSEACVFKGGQPWQGLTPKVDWYHNASKFYVPLSDIARSGEDYEFLIEAAANDLFGSGKDVYTLKECALVEFHEDIFQFFIDLEVLNDLMQSLPSGEMRRTKLLKGLNDCCNIYADGKGLAEASKILKALLEKPANASALTAYSVGHAHLDLAWLWPIRETKRKGGRTFANALRLLESYPDYIFGASQAQLYKWMKELYPALYEDVKLKVSEGRWELQGASWVEFDTNLICGESIIRQFLYGMRFFQQEFGHYMKCLWLPDCFGFSGNLPQFLKGCGIDFFITQKLSWNETNTFPQHLFIWQGIDGSEVKAHQLPTNDYNFSNNPSAFRQTEARYSQTGAYDALLNLYGIGDGGGGPTRNHIEYGLRQRDLEGVCKFRFARAQEFLDYFDALPVSGLEKVYGELYLEYHRGTYTTQARMKQWNRKSEQLLSIAEFTNALKLSGYPEKLRPLWEDTLLLQFHDILPGSSIAAVYKDAREISEKNHLLLEGLCESYLKSTFSTEDIASEQPGMLIVNPCGATLRTWIQVPDACPHLRPVINGCSPEHYYLDKDRTGVFVTLQPWSVSLLWFDKDGSDVLDSRSGSGMTVDSVDSRSVSGMTGDLQNDLLKIQINSRGGVSSIIDLVTGKELLASESNQLLLWEDEPNNWGAWDINHFYRETTPGTATLKQTLSLWDQQSGYNRLVQELSIGASVITQTVELYPGERIIRISHEVNWMEKHKMLRVGFAPEIHCTHASCGIQMGYVKRSTKAQNAWEAARFEFPAQDYIDLSDAEHGFALICKDKYGYSLQENRMEMTLLRSPADVDPNADIGLQHYSYAFYCHPKPFERAQVAETAEAFGIRPLILDYPEDSPSFASKEKLRTASGYDLLPGNSLFSTTEHKLLIKTIKPSESGEGIVLRLFEPLGRTATDLLISQLPIRKLIKCNLLEEPVIELDPEQAIEAGPFEIITLLLLPKESS